MKKNYIFYLRELHYKNQSVKTKFILSYQISDKNLVETKLNNLIEVPFERSDTLESIKFQI